MALTSRLALEVDGRNAEQQILAVRRALEGLNEAGLRAGPVLNGASANINGAARTARTATDQVQTLERQVKSLAASAAGLAGPLAAAFSVKAFYDAAEAYSTLTNRMKLVTSSAAELAAAQKAVFSIAQSAYQPLTATAELYQRIATNQKELKLTGEGVAAVVGTISKTLAISGASAASANAALIQLGQAFASGVLRGEELNSVMEQAPALAQAIAKGMGKTVGELRTLGQAGLLTADTVVKALQAQRGAVDELFNKTAVTIGNSLTAAGNSFTQFIGKIDQASGASAAISAQIVGVSKAIDTLTLDNVALAKTLSVTEVAMAGIGAGAATFLASKIALLTIETGKSVTSFYTQRAASIASAEASLVAAKAREAAARQAVINAELEARASLMQVRASAAVVAARAEEVAATTAVTAAQAGARAASTSLLGVLAGPAGLALLVGSVAASYFLFRDSANDATKALIDQNLTLDESIAKFRELGEAQRALQVTTWSEKQGDAADAASKAFEDFSMRGRQAFQDLGVAGIEGAKSFDDMLLSVKAGYKTLPEVTAWVKQNKEVMPGYVKLLEEAAAANEISGKQVEKYGALLSQVDGLSKSATESTKQLAGAQSSSGNQTKAQAAEYQKYIDKLTETRDLLGANKEAEAAYTIKKMGLTAEQEKQVTVVSKQIDVLDQYKEAIKKGDKAEQDSLRIKLVALYTEEQAAKDTADAIKAAHAETVRAAKEATDKTIAEMDRIVAKAKSITSGRNLLLLPEQNDRKNQTGYGLLTNGGIPPAPTAPEVQTPSQRADAAIAQLNQTTEANKKVDKAANEAARALKAQQKALEDLTEKSAIATSTANSMADAYLAGADNVRALTIQQEIEQELLKTGAGARDKVTAAINALHDAEDRRDVAKAVSELKLENGQTLALAAATLRGKDAIDAYNVQKSIQTQLAGKNIKVGGEEYKQLLATTKAQLEANKALEQAGKVESITDRLYPQTKLLRDYREEQAALNEAMRLYPERAGDYMDALKRLGVEYQANQQAATAWGQITEAAVDRIDDAFADMWKSVLSKSGDFMDTLKNSFRQFLAEMLHLAITKPIIVQIGSALGVGGLSGQSSGIFGSSSGAGGGLNLESAWNGVSGAYSVATSGFGQAVSAGWSAGEGFLGGVQGAFKAGAGTLSAGISGLFSTGTGTMVNGVYQLSASAAPATVDLIANTVSNSATGAVTGTATGATTAASAGLSASTAVMAGIGGAIQGYLKAGVKGAVAGAGGAVAGAYAGAAIGSVVPIIGNVIGAAIGAVIGGWFGSSLFGGDWITKDQGFQLGVTDGELQSSSFEYQKKKGGLFSSNKKRTRLTAMDPELQAALDTTYASTLGSVIGLFDSLDVTLNDAVLDGLNVAATQISTKDKTAEQIQEELAKWFTGLGDAAVAEVNKVTGSGLDGFNLESLTTFVNNLYSVNASFDMIGVKMVDFNIAGGRAVENLVALAGGMDNLNAYMTKFYDGFTTDTQKSVDTLDGVRAQFAAMGLTLPGTRAAFAEAVKGLDMTSAAERQIFNSMTANAEQAAAAYTILEQRQSAYNGAFLSESENTARSITDLTAQIKAMGVELPGARSAFRGMVESAANDTSAEGKALYESLMNVAGLAGQAFDAIEQQATTAAQAISESLLGAATNSQSALQRAIAAEQKAATAAYNARVAALNDMSSTASKNVSDLTSVSNSLGSALKALRGDSDQAVQMLRTQAQATIQSALATVKAGGSLAGFTGLDEALSTVSSNTTDLYSSLEDFNRDQGRTANVVAELNALNGKQLTSAEQTVKTLQGQLDQAKEAYDAQIAQFDAQSQFAQDQIDALNGVDNSVMSVVDAVNAMNAAVVAALAVVKPSSSTNTGTLIDSVYQDLLGKNADAPGKEYWQGQVGNGSISLDQLAGAVKNAATENAIKAAYQSSLGRDADAAGAQYWAGQVASGALTIAQLQDAIRNAAKANGSIPAFAMGGFHSGGIRLVGEKGPEIEATGPARYFSAAKTTAMLGTGDQQGVIDAINGLQNYLYMITKYGEQTASGIRRQNEVGIPMQEVA